MLITLYLIIGLVVATEISKGKPLETKVIRGVFWPTALLLFTLQATFFIVGVLSVAGMLLAGFLLEVFE